MSLTLNSVTASRALELETKLPWVSMTPFGMPVVPEV